MSSGDTTREFMAWVVARCPGEDVFHQAVTEVVASVWPVFERHPEYLMRLCRAELDPSVDSMLP